MFTLFPSAVGHVIRVLNEHLIWFFENKRSLEEGLKIEKETKKMVEEVKKIVKKKAAKKSKFAEGLKMQLHGKMDTIKEKNQ